MNIGSLGEVLNILRQLTDVYTPTQAALDTPDPKPKFTPCEMLCPLECATPESEGVSSELIFDYIKELRDDRTIEMQNIMIIRNSKKLFEISFEDHNMKIWKATYSASKSIVSLAVGFAVSEGLMTVDTLIADIFQDEVGTRRVLKDVTVRDLLTMRSAVPFGEAESIFNTEWKRGYLFSSPKGAPGKVFNYNSLNTYMLAAAIVKLTGESLTDYLKPRLFDPLGITNFYWEKSPEGIEKGGWGLYILPEDAAKIGVCVLDGGKWRGKQIIPAEWVREATFPKAETPRDAGRFDYGYQIWCGRDSDTFLFNGMFGQNVFAFRSHNILIVSNCANSEVFQGSNYYKITLKYFADTRDKRISSAALPENPEALAKLYSYAEKQRIGYKKDSALPDECDELDGIELFPASDAAKSVGLLPLALQIVGSNYTKGTESIRFETSDNKFYVIYRENDAIHRFPVGFGRPLSVNMNFRGAVFRVAVSGEFAKNEDGVNVLKLRLCFVETPFVRGIKIFFDKGEYCITFTETPSETFAVDNIIDIKASLEEKMLLKGTVSRIDDDYLEYKIRRTFRPTLYFYEKGDKTE